MDALVDVAPDRRAVGDAVRQGEPIALLYTDREEKLPEAVRLYSAAITIGKEPPPVRPLVYARLEKDGIAHL